MLHVRVVSPPGLTKHLVEQLSADPGIRNLLVLPGAARRPRGDAVQFDLLSRLANPVLRELRDIPASDGGSVVIESVDAALDSGAEAAAAAKARHRELAPVWTMVEARIRADGVYPPSFFVLLICAGLIGAVGILTNSQILVVAAMVVGPEYNAIMATALGINRRHHDEIRDGLFALVAGFAMAIGATVVFGLLVRWSGRAPTAFVSGVRPVSNLIDTPNLFSVVVAVLAGVVGVVSLTESRAATLIGVFISVTTIPAASDIGLSAAFASWSEMSGSAVQLLLNVVLLIAVGAGGLSLQRRIWRRWQTKAG
jgi:uncharacterized hydrophobic protein (TIGR00271 family)